MRCLRWLGRGVGVLTALAVSVGAALAQERPYGFVYLMGADTMGIERVSRPQPNVVVGHIHSWPRPSPCPTVQPAGYPPW